MTADAASACGMPMAQLSAETRSALAGILPSFATTTNPVDVTAALLTNSRLFSDILPVLSRDPAADAFLIGIPVAGSRLRCGRVRPRLRGVHATRPASRWWWPPRSRASRRSSGTQGLPVFATESEAVAALNQLLSHLELMRAAVASRVGYSDALGAACGGTRANDERGGQPGSAQRFRCARGRAPAVPYLG